MHRKKKFRKYFVPIILALFLAASLVCGIFYIRSFMMQQTIQERSSQLEEMLLQVRVNLEYGLETHWKNAQWWIENPALQELLIDLSGWPGYPEYSSAG